MRIAEAAALFWLTESIRGRGDLGGTGLDTKLFNERIIATRKAEVRKHSGGCLLNFGN